MPDGAVQQKAKVPTKGFRQINADNIDTIKFYRNMIGGTAAAVFVLSVALYEFTLFWLLMNLSCVAVLLGALKFMHWCTKVSPEDNDCAVDLNAEGGSTEHVKDLIIWLCCTMGLANLSNWFWLLLLMIPARIIYALWGSVIKPWFFQNDQENAVEENADEKRQKRLDRKMRRYQR